MSLIKEIGGNLNTLTRVTIECVVCMNVLDSKVKNFLEMGWCQLVNVYSNATEAVARVCSTVSGILHFVPI